MISIPFFEYPSFTEELEIDGTTYILKFNWNSRFSFWTISFYDVAQNPIVTGIKIVLNINLLAQFRAYAVPSGELRAVDASGNNRRIAQKDFVNGRLLLIYASEEELE